MAPTPKLVFKMGRFDKITLTESFSTFSVRIQTNTNHIQSEEKSTSALMLTQVRFKNFVFLQSNIRSHNKNIATLPTLSATLQ
jgi:hypothetical protein